MLVKPKSDDEIRSLLMKESGGKCMGQRGLCGAVHGQGRPKVILMLGLQGRTRILVCQRCALEDMKRRMGWAVRGRYFKRKPNPAQTVLV